MLGSLETLSVIGKANKVSVPLKVTINTLPSLLLFSIPKPL